MLLSHIAAGFAGKKFAPNMSLGTLAAAGTLSDIAYSVFASAGIEHARIVPGITAVNSFDMYDYPLSHGLVANIIGAALFAGIYYALKKDKRSALVSAAIVLSHWILDVISHRPDMPLLGNGGPKLGLGLWYSFAGTVAVETALTAAGLAIYLSVTKGKRRLSVLPLTLLVLYMVFMFAGWLLGPMPEDMTKAYVTSAVFQIILLALAYWTDSLRENRSLPIRP